MRSGVALGSRHCADELTDEPTAAVDDRGDERHHLRDLFDRHAFARAEQRCELVAEATVSYLGLGFPDAAASWGTMLQDAANVRVMSEAPWMLAPAVGVFIVALAAQVFGMRRVSHVLR